MEYTGDGVQDIRIAYIGGGSRGWAWNLMSDLALEEDLCGSVRLYDIDQKAAENNAFIGNALSEREEAKSAWRYEAVHCMGEALENADFVIISILPGTFEEMSSDVHTPEDYGIYQPVGDTTGPGGLIRSLRTIPMYVEFAEAIRDHAPKAWVINYTNPMSLCVRTLYEIFPGIKAFGCCHEVFGTQNLLSQMLEEMAGIDGVSREEIQVNVLGINHFTWLSEASYRGRDLLPLYERFVDKYYDEGYERERGAWKRSHFGSAQRVKFDLFTRFGAIAAAGDRHLAEFVPKSWFLEDPETVREWKFNLTPVEWRKADRKKKVEKSLKLCSGKKELDLTKSGEEGVRQIKALLGLEELVTNVNLPNRGQLEGVPRGAIVETNALFRRDSLRPVNSGPLPKSISGLIRGHISNQEAVLRAALERDRRMALAAFINDPLVDISLDKAEDLFDRMLANTEEYLPPEWEI